MGGLLAVGGVSGVAFGRVAVDFLLQMTIGVIAGVAGGMVLLWFMRRVSLPSEALYPLRTLVSVLPCCTRDNAAARIGFPGCLRGGHCNWGSPCSLST